MYDIVLFDLDGTLTDPGLGITNSVAHALKYWNIEVKDRSELYGFIGPPLSESFCRYFGFSPEEGKQAVERYREYFNDIGIFENQLYPGTEKMLACLKEMGKKIILATSKPEVLAKRILVHFGLDSYFDHIAGAAMDGSRVKKADVITYALETFGLTGLDRMVMIGDREYDILGAKQVGMDSIGVLYGYGSRKELEAAGADYIAQTMDDILKIV